MAYAQVNHENRIINWSEDYFTGFDVEFSNGDYVNQTCVDGSLDFVIRDGIAYFEPPAYKEIEQLKKQLAETDYINHKLTEQIIDASNLSEVLQQHQEKYGELIQQRQQWRDRINELEKAMKV